MSPPVEVDALPRLTPRQGGTLRRTLPRGQPPRSTNPNPGEVHIAHPYKVAEWFQVIVYTAVNRPLHDTTISKLPSELLCARGMFMFLGESIPGLWEYPVGNHVGVSTGKKLFAVHPVEILDAWRKKTIWSHVHAYPHD